MATFQILSSLGLSESKAKQKAAITNQADQADESAPSATLFPSVPQQTPLPEERKDDYINGVPATTGEKSVQTTYADNENTYDISEKRPGYFEGDKTTNFPIHDDENQRIRRRESSPEHISQPDRQSDQNPSLKDTQVNEKENRKNRRITWTKKNISIVGLASFAIVVGLTIGLGVGLSKKAHITTGALKGSGIVALEIGDVSKITTYAQRDDGKIVRSQYSDGDWTGGESSDVVETAYKVKKKGPLMALSHTYDEELTWNVFYVTEDGFLANTINSNRTNSSTNAWIEGGLRLGNYAVVDSPSVGLSACVNEQWYGEPYNISDWGIRLYYGSADSGNIQELSYGPGMTTWDKGWTFKDTNGAGGVECTVRGSSITYVWLETIPGNLTMMWKEFNTSAITATHPVDKWVPSGHFVTVTPNSSISAINTDTRKFVHYQDPNDKTIREIVVNGTAENCTWGNTYTVGTLNPLFPTRIGSVVLNTTINDGLEVHVMFETNDRSIVDTSRTLDSYIWAQSEEVPVGVYTK